MEEVSNPDLEDSQHPSPAVEHDHSSDNTLLYTSVVSSLSLNLMDRSDSTAEEEQLIESEIISF